MKNRIVYDISILLMGELNNSNRTGVYFCAYSILNEMLQDQDVEIHIYSKPIVSCLAEDFMKNHFDIGSEQVIEQGIINTFISRLWTKIEKERLYNRKKKKVQYYFLCILKRVIEFLAVLSEIRLENRVNGQFEYFSPMEQAPKSIRRNSSVSKYIVVHDVIAYKKPEYFPGFNSFLNNHWLKAVVEKELNNAYYFANSLFTQRDFIDVCKFANNENVGCVYHACRDFYVKKNEDEINKVREKYNIPFGKKYVFSLCAIEPRKNLPRILRTFFEFIERENIEDLVFVLGGTSWNSFEKSFSSEIGKIQKHTDKLIKIGYVEDQDLPALYSGAYWFVYTSEYEGFGVPPLEALKCGCPVIVSDSSSIPEVVGEAGQYVKWNSDEEHIAAYKKYYFDSDFRATMSRLGLERSALFSWQKTTTEILTKMLSDKTSGVHNEVS